MKHHSALASDLPDISYTVPQRTHGPALDADGTREVFGWCGIRTNSKKRRIMTDEDFARRNRNEEGAT